MGLKISSFYKTLVDLETEKIKQIEIFKESFKAGEISSLEEIVTKIEQNKSDILEKQKNFIEKYTSLKGQYSDVISKHNQLSRKNKKVNLKFITEFLLSSKENIKKVDESTILDLFKGGDKDSDAYQMFDDNRIYLEKITEEIESKNSLLTIYMEKIEQYNSKKEEVENALKLKINELGTKNEEGLVLFDVYSDQELTALKKCYEVLNDKVKDIESEFTVWLGQLESKIEEELEEREDDDDSEDEEFNAILNKFLDFTEKITEIDYFIDNIKKIQELTQKVEKNLETIQNGG